MADAVHDHSSNLFHGAVLAAEAANRVTIASGHKVASDRLVRKIRAGKVAHDVFQEVATSYSETVLMQCLSGSRDGQVQAQAASQAAVQLLDAVQGWYQSRPGWRRIAFRTARQVPLLADRLNS